MQRKLGISWGALILGLAVGLAGGLYYAWAINPLRYENIGPRELKAANQQAYILLVSHAYLHDLDLGRAKQRLSALGQGDIGTRVGALADDAYLHGGNPNDIRALTVLAEALGAHPRAAEVFSGTLPPTGVVPATVTATFEGIASPTLTETQGAETSTPEVEESPTATTIQLPENATMKLTVLKPICLDSYAAGRLEVYVVDAAGGGIPAVKVQVEWEGNTDTFFTGLKPEISPGYADFQMEKGKTYTVTLPGLSEPVVGISSVDCQTESGKVSTPSYQLVFQPATP